MTPQHRSLTPPVSSKLASASPAPPDAQPPLRRLWVCDQCFAYNRDQKGYGAHRAACKLIRPPGEQIYSYGITVWKVSGQEQKLFCQNLSLFAKLFIDFKAITFDVSHFDFYVVCELENRKDQIVGFFSKEIRSHENYNLATYLVFPPWMGQKYGTLMMEMSYHLTRLGPPGTPERPLSALGEVAYATFWARTILRRLLEFAVWAVGDHTWRDKWLRIAAEGRPIAVQDFEQTPEMPVGQLRLTVDEVARLAHLQPDDVAVALTHLGFSSAQQPDVRLSFYSLLELCSTWKVYARTVMNPKGFKAK